MNQADNVFGVGSEGILESLGLELAGKCGAWGGTTGSLGLELTVYVGYGGVVLGVRRRSLGLAYKFNNPTLKGREIFQDSDSGRVLADMIWQQA